jgi:hypothetical protein
MLQSQLDNLLWHDYLPAVAAMYPVPPTTAWTPTPTVGLKATPFPDEGYHHDPEWYELYWTTFAFVPFAEPGDI